MIIENMTLIDMKKKKSPTVRKSRDPAILDREELFLQLKIEELSLREVYCNPISKFFSKWYRRQGLKTSIIPGLTFSILRYFLNFQLQKKFLAIQDRGIAPFSHCAATSQRWSKLRCNVIGWKLWLHRCCCDFEKYSKVSINVWCRSDVAVA